MVDGGLCTGVSKIKISHLGNLYANSCKAIEIHIFKEMKNDAKDMPAGLPDFLYPVIRGTVNF
jgi:hypothetical protein